MRPAWINITPQLILGEEDHRKIYDLTNTTYGRLHVSDVYNTEEVHPSDREIKRQAWEVMKGV